MRREYVRNELTQAERRRVLRETGTSYHEVALSEADTVGGRYAAESKRRVVGSASFKYPPQPANSPWASDPVGLEPPLNQDVNAVEPVGTFAEIVQSLGGAQDGAGSPPGAIEYALPGGEQRSGSSEEAAPPPPPKRKRKR